MRSTMIKQHFLARVLAALITGLAASAAWSAVGLTEVPGVRGDGPVTVYYPTNAQAAMVRYGPFTENVAAAGEPARGNGRLVVISHGSGGSPRVHADVARALVEAGFVVALPQHQGDNVGDTSKRGPESWKLRPAEVSRAIDAVAADRRFAAILALDKVGMYGMSAGGHTALTLAGGRWSPALFRNHCEAHIGDDFHTCAGLSTRLTGGPLDGVKKTVVLGVVRNRFADETWHAHTDPRVAAVVAGVPVAADFDMASLATPRVPLALVAAAKDKWLAPRFHSSAVLASCLPRCELLADLPTAGHGALISPLPPMDALPETLRELMADPPGFDRSQMPAVDAKIAAFMRRHLLP